MTIRVVFDDTEKAFLCSGRGYTFRAMFAGEGDRRVLEAEIFGPTGGVIGIFSFATPGSFMPTADEVAEQFDVQMDAMLSRIEGT